MTTIKTIEGAAHAAPSARDLTTKQWYAAIIVPDTNQIDVAAANADVAGIIQYPGDRAGRPTTILTKGRLKVKVAYNAQAGDRLTTDANGAGVKATTGKKSFGIVLENTPNGGYAPFDFDRSTEP